ncbi:MAG: DUF2271 domain-containing protein [Bryobacteraceae bacterium]|nr:DUF2271 domain-containing protein [Bryobacteraceae bacterium]
MRRRDLFLTAAGVIALPPAARAAVFLHENVLGTSLEMRFASATPALAEQAALAEIDRLAALLSSYDPSSEVSRWAATRNVAVPVSAELGEVLGLYDHWRERTGGALSAAFGAGEAAGERHWRLGAGTATHLTDAPLVLNSFTKSYILSRAADAAMAHAEGALVNIGGDLVVRGNLRETVRIANPADDTENSTPLATIRAQNLAVATSGTSRRGAHIVDPRTGLRPTHVASATVVAERATDAGALATAFTVLPVRESQALASRMPGVEYLLARADGGIVQSAGWRRLLLAPSAAQAPAPFEVIVNLELARIEGQRYRRPYVAVWVEDKDRFPVRTVALWLEKDRWLPELKGWYRDDRLRLLAEGNEIVTTVSSATRPPGKYTLKWDGKDAKGALVKPGKYTICVEASREHGSYQILRQEIDLAGAAKQFPLTGGTEIASASIDFHRNAR